MDTNPENQQETQQSFTSKALTALKSIIPTPDKIRSFFTRDYAQDLKDLFVDVMGIDQFIELGIDKEKLIPAASSIIQALEKLKANPDLEIDFKEAHQYLALAIKQSGLDPNLILNDAAYGYFQLTDIALEDLAQKHPDYKFTKDDIVLSDPESATPEQISQASINNSTAGILFYHICRDRYGKKLATDWAEADLDKLGAFIYNQGYTTVKNLWNHLGISTDFDTFAAGIAGILDKHFPEISLPEGLKQVIHDNTYDIDYTSYLQFDKSYQDFIAKFKGGKFEEGGHTFEGKTLSVGLRSAGIIYALMSMPGESQEAADAESTPESAPSEKPIAAYDLASLDFDTVAKGHLVWNMAKDLHEKCQDDYLFDHFSKDGDRKEQILELSDLIVEFNKEVGNEIEPTSLHVGDKVYIPSYSYLSEKYEESKSEIFGSSYMWGVAKNVLKRCKEDYKISEFIDSKDREADLWKLVEITILYNQEIKENPGFKGIDPKSEKPDVAAGTEVFYPTKYFVLQHVRLSEDERKEKENFSDISFEGGTVRSDDRVTEETSHIPYRYMEGPSGFTSNSGNIGTEKAKYGYNPEWTKKQVEMLREQDRRVIFAFGHHRAAIAEDAKKAEPDLVVIENAEDIEDLEKLFAQETPPPLVVVTQRMRETSQPDYKINLEIYKGIAFCIENDIGVHTCCDWGAHRAIVTMMCGWMLSGRVSTLGQAYIQSGGDVEEFIRNTKKRGLPLRNFFKQAVNLADDYGIEVEPEFRKFADDIEYRPTHKELVAAVRMPDEQKEEKTAEKEESENELISASKSEAVGLKDSLPDHLPVSDKNKSKYSFANWKNRGTNRNYPVVDLKHVGKIRITSGYFENDKAHSYKKGTYKGYLEDGSYVERGQDHYNLGIDYVVQTKNKAVYSWYGGEVVWTGTNGGYGKRVIVKTDLTFQKDGKEYHVYQAYGHLASYKVSIGDQVEQGAHLGKMGKTGTKSEHVDLRTFAIPKDEEFFITPQYNWIELHPNLVENTLQGK